MTATAVSALTKLPGSRYTRVIVLVLGEDAVGLVFGQFLAWVRIAKDRVQGLLSVLEVLSPVVRTATVLILQVLDVVVSNRLLLEVVYLRVEFNRDNLMHALGETVLVLVTGFLAPLLIVPRVEL